MHNTYYIQFRSYDLNLISEREVFDQPSELSACCSINIVGKTAKYSASVVDRTTSLCKCDLMGPDDNLISIPEVDRLVHGSAPNSASVYASRIAWCLFLKSLMP